MRKGARQKRRTANTPSRCRNENQTSALGVLDEIRQSVFFQISILLDVSIPPAVWVSKMGVGESFFFVVDHWVTKLF